MASGGRPWRWHGVGLVVGWLGSTIGTAWSEGRPVEAPKPSPVAVAVAVAVAVPVAAPVAVPVPVPVPVADPRTGVEWVRIEGGTFLMGADATRPDIEVDTTPIRKVTVPTFELAKTEVTVAQYRRCVVAGSCTLPLSELESSDCNFFNTGGDEHPVNCVDWEQAQAFADWAEARLPSEAEWEYAARSGGRAQPYPWGHEAPTCERAVMEDSALLPPPGQPVPEGGKEPDRLAGRGCGTRHELPVCSRPKGHSAQGVCDLLGNVGEWVADWYGPYGEAPADGSARTQAAEERVVRGGDYTQVEWNAATREYSVSDPLSRTVFVGFRVARGGAVRRASRSRRTGGAAGVTWVRLPGGTFEMGSRSEADDDSTRPVRQVTVQPFELGKTEVTVAQYRRCVAAGHCPDLEKLETQWSSDCNWALPERAHHPINCVSWMHARAFAAWAGARLPTEAEWEYAARSGGRAITYPWGNEAATCDRAVMENCSEESAPVCSKPKGRSAQGVCDLAGNVAEWVEDWWVPYEKAPTDGRPPTVPFEYEDDVSGYARVQRGGSFDFNTADVRARARDRDDPGEMRMSVGFRLARSRPVRGQKP